VRLTNSFSFTLRRDARRRPRRPVSVHRAGHHTPLFSIDHTPAWMKNVPTLRHWREQVSPVARNYPIRLLNALLEMQVSC
jgi:hypothetical protein